MSAVPDSDSASRSEPMGPFDQVMSDAMDRAEVSIAGSSSSSSSLPPPPQPTGPGAALLRARANFQLSSSTSSNSSTSTSSTSAASVVPTAKDIGTYKSMLCNLLLLTIPKRKKTAKGRFDKYETARRDYISNCARPRRLPLPRLEIEGLPLSSLIFRHIRGLLLSS